jgi:hypothetical protein
LNADGSYAARWDGCLGEYGSAKGTWVYTAGQVVFTPRAERGQMVGHLRQLTAVRYKDKALLVPGGRDGDFFVDHGPSNFSCFHRPGDLPRWWDDAPEH